MGINDILNIARTGLAVNQAGIRVTGHNIANVNTEGFSRQRVDVNALGAYHGLSGVGASIAEVRRVHDEFLQRQVQREVGMQSFLEGRKHVAQHFDAIFPELEEDGINTSMNKFFNSFRELSQNPSGNAERQMVVLSSERFIGRMKLAYERIEDTQSNMTEDILTKIEEVNKLLDQVAELNRKVASIIDPTGENQAADLMDERDQTLKELGRLIPIDTFFDKNGHINVMMNNTVIVEGVQAASLQRSGSYLPGIEVNTLGGQSLDVTDYFRREEGAGELNGLLYERDVFLEKIKTRMDNLAYNMADQINQVHSGAFGMVDATSRNFFVDLGGVVDGAAKRLELNPDITDNPSHIAAAFDATSTHGDNRAAMAIADLQNDDTLMGDATFNEHFTSTMVLVSNELSSLQSNIDYQDMVVEQTENYRSSVSGVSTDEEMVQLMQYERAFQASSKMVTTADGMLETVLSLVR